MTNMPVKLSDSARAQIQALLDTYPQDGHPGTVVGVVNRHGAELFLGTTGLKDVQTREKYDRDTIFWVASVTKLVASVAALQLVEAGKLALDAPVAEIAPELAGRDIVVSSTPERLEMRAAQTPITLRMLLTHTAGLAYPFYNEHIARWAKQNGRLELGPLDAPLVAEPGTAWNYSTATDWVGKIVERASGQTLDAYCQEHIFGPLGMRSSTWDLDLHPELRPRVATLHKWDGKASFAPTPFPPGIAEKTRFHQGGGGLLTSVPDYLQLLAAVMSGGAGRGGVRILREETVREMLRPQTLHLEGDALGGLGTDVVVQTVNPAVSGPMMLLPGVRKAWGLGSLLNLDAVPGGRPPLTAQWAGITNLVWLADPTSGVGFLVANEILPFGVPAFGKLVMALEKILFADGALVEAAAL